MKKMKPAYKPFVSLLTVSLIASTLGLAGCNKSNNDSNAGNAVAASAAASSVDVSAASIPVAASAATASQPMTAVQLYQLVAPIALFPDTLVAQVLAGAAHPDQITAANTWVTQHTGLKGTALQNAVDPQPWDVSVKSLAAFPVVLNQMATGLPWATSLGQAYVNDPNDLMNAIQVMRLRATECGNLKSSPQLKVSQAPRSQVAPSGDPVIVAPPPQVVVIELAQPHMVYVPLYNPAVVYGAPLALYPGYVYQPYSVGGIVTTGVISFGLGIAISAAIGHYGWGWHSWDMNWRGDRYHDPAVMFNHSAYGPRSAVRSEPRDERQEAQNREQSERREGEVSRESRATQHEVERRPARAFAQPRREENFHGIAQHRGGGGRHEERR